MSSPIDAKKRFGFCLVMLVFAVLGGGVATVMGLTSPGANAVHQFYWYVLPALPFIALIAVALMWKGCSLGRLVGAAVGAVLAIAIPHVFLVLAVAAKVTPGVNMGAALVFMALPIYLPVLMLAGVVVAGRKPVS